MADDAHTPAAAAKRHAPALALLIWSFCFAVVTAVLWIVSNVYFVFNVWYWVAPACFTGLLTTVLMIAGAVRWGVHGLLGRPASVKSGGGDLELLQSINDRLLISDQAKRIAYRRQDRDALRTAIREDIDKGDFEAALVLASDMGALYGYREESEQFRDEILIARESYVQRKVSEAIASLDQLLASHQWHRALTEASKIQRLYPDSPKAHGLEQYVRDAFEQYKLSLCKQFDQADQRDDVELAMELLAEMDKYLTEAEASQYREAARRVIAKKRDNLGVQFRMAVHDRDSGRAYQIAQQIIAQFPNTKMADELRAKLDDLKKAAEQENAAEI